MMSPDARAAVAFLRELRAQLRREFNSLTGLAALAAFVAAAAFVTFVTSTVSARSIMIPAGITFALALVLAIWAGGRGAALAKTLDGIEESLVTVLRVIKAEQVEATAGGAADYEQTPRDAGAISDGS